MMAQLIDKNSLVAEIDKRLHQLTDAAFDSMIGRNLIEIKDFLDTLEVKEVQKEPVSEDLEEEIIRYIGFPQEVDEDVSTTMIRKAAHHFANWQKSRNDNLEEVAPEQ